MRTAAQFRVHIPSLRAAIRLKNSAFTLLELMTVIVVIAILATMLMPAMQGVQRRVERINCTSNLKGLFVATESYIQDNGHWPQIDSALIKGDASDHKYSQAWINALARYGIAQKVWICPTHQRSLQNPDYTKPEKVRIDYLAMPFDTAQFTPHRWPSQPWFVERASAHGSGNLVIFTDGSVQALFEITHN